MIRWLNRYLFRGIGILMVIGMITLLLLAVVSQRQRRETGARPLHAPAGARK